MYTCEHCGEAIVVGDEYYEVDGKHYHEECFEDNALVFLYELFGIRKNTAEVEEDDRYDSY